MVTPRKSSKNNETIFREITLCHRICLFLGVCELPQTYEEPGITIAGMANWVLCGFVPLQDAHDAVAVAYEGFSFIFRLT